MDKREDLNIWIFGTSGSGKSALCNALVNDRNRRTFPETKTSRSTNRELINQAQVTLITGQEVQLVDTEGFSNPDIPEQSLYDRTHDVLKALRTVNRFLVVLNSAEPRLDTKTQRMIDLFVEMTGNSMLNNLSVVFTRWSYDSRSIKGRERQKVSETSKTDEINAFFRTKFNHSGIVPCFFVDSSFEENDEGADRCVEQLRLLIDSFFSTPAFQTASIQTVNVNPVVNYINYSNTESGDTYNRKMTARKVLVSRIEVYFDNRETNLTRSLINDTFNSLPSLKNSDFLCISEKNYKAYLIEGSRLKLPETIKKSLISVFERPEISTIADLGFVDESLNNINQNNETDTLYVDVCVTLCLGGVAGAFIQKKFLSKWRKGTPMIVSMFSFFVTLLVTKRIFWTIDGTRKQTSLDLTQRIAYTNKLKQKCIELADKLLEKSG